MNFHFTPHLQSKAIVHRGNCAGSNVAIRIYQLLVWVFQFLRVICVREMLPNLVEVWKPPIRGVAIIKGKSNLYMATTRRCCNMVSPNPHLLRQIHKCPEIL